MPYAYPEIKTMRGLYQQRNSFTVPDGALETALNLTVKNDNILSSRTLNTIRFVHASHLHLQRLHLK